MPSNITPNIDATFPIAGQDNNSQGFRNNFANMNTNLTTAATEISDLQSKVLLKSALNGTTVVDNNLTHSTLISNALTLGFTKQFLDITPVTPTTNIAINFLNGDVQKLTTAVPVVLGSFLNAPITGCATLRLWINITNLAHTITFPASIQYGAVTNMVARVFTPKLTGDYFFELTTVDAGVSYTISLVGGPQATDVVSIANANTGNITILQGNVVTISNNVLLAQQDIVTVNGVLGTINTSISGLQTNQGLQATDITDLKGNVLVLQSNLTTLSNTVTTQSVLKNATNAMGGNVIAGSSGAVATGVVTIGNVTINSTTADFYSIPTTGNVTLNFVWPATSASYSKVRVLANIAAGNSITFPTEVVSSSGLSIVAATAPSAQSVTGNTLTSVISGEFMFEFSKDCSVITNPVYIQEIIHP